MISRQDEVVVRGLRIAELAQAYDSLFVLAENQPGLLRVSDLGSWEIVEARSDLRSLAGTTDALYAASSDGVVSISADGVSRPFANLPAATALSATERDVFALVGKQILRIPAGRPAAPLASLDDAGSRALVFCANAFWVAAGDDVFHLAAGAAGARQFSPGVGRVADLACSNGCIVAAGADDSTIAILDPAADADFVRIELALGAPASAIAAAGSRLWVAAPIGDDTRLIVLTND